MKVTDPYGQTWRVSRRWVPWRRRTQPEMPWLPDLEAPDASADDLVTLVLRVLPVAVALVLLVGVSALLMVELLFLLLLLPFAVLGRLLLGRHWVVEVRAGYQPVWEVDSGSWEQSREAIHELGTALRRGAHPWDTVAGGLTQGRILQDWVASYSTSDHATFLQRRRLRLGDPASGAGADG